MVYYTIEMQNPSFETVFEEVRPFLVGLRKTLQLGVTGSSSLSGQLPEIDVDPIMRSQFVRGYQVKHLPSELTDDYLLQVGFNQSLTVCSRSYRCRILKKSGKSMPRPGSSPGRKHFYTGNKDGELFRALDGEPTATEETQSINLVIGWGRNRQGKIDSIVVGKPVRDLSAPAGWKWEFAREVLVMLEQDELTGLVMPEHADFNQDLEIIDEPFADDDSDEDTGQSAFGGPR